MTRRRGEEGCMHAMFGGGALVIVLVVLLILILTSSLPLPPSAQLGGLDPARAVGLLLLAIVVPAVVGALLGGWPVRLPLGWPGRRTVKPEELADAELRLKFERMLEYRQGIGEVARGVGDGEPRRLLGELLRASDEPLPALFRLAKEVEDRRQSRLLRSDLVRLRSKTEPLSAAEREQLASLERLDEVARLSGRLIDDTRAILGRCYAESRELALARNLAEGDAQHLMGELREQAGLLGHVTEALREIHAGRR